MNNEIKQNYYISFLRIVTILLNIFMLVFVFLISFFSFYYFNEIEIHSKILINSNENEILVKSKKSEFTDSNIKDFFKNIGLDYNKINFNKHIQIKSNKINFAGFYTNNLKFPYFDDSQEIVPIFKTYTANQFQSLNIIGDLPNGNNEILISKILADNIIEKGIYVIDEDKIIQSKFFNYEELINSKAKIYFGDTFLIVSGIVEEDLTKFESLKNNFLYTKELKNLYKEYEYYSKKQNILIVKDDFFENLRYNDCLKMNFTNYSVNPDYYYNSINIDKINYYKNFEMYINDNFVTSVDLKDNQIIIDLFTLDLLTEHKFTNEYILWKNKNINNYDNFKIFLKKFIDDNKILENKLDLVIKNDDGFEKKENDMYITGVILDKYSYLESLVDGFDITTLSTPTLLLNSNIVDKYDNRYSQKTVNSLSIKITDKKELKSLLKILEKNEKYDYETKYKSLIKDSTSKVFNIKILLCILILFLIITKLFIIYFLKKINNK